MSDALQDRPLDIVAERPERRGRRHVISVEPCPKRVRTVFGDVTIADSTRVLLLLESKHLPVYYFPVEDVRMDLLEPTEHATHCPYKGDASYWSIKVDGRLAEDAVWGYQDPLPERADIKGHVAFYWNKVDAWFEEDDEVFVHPRDPYHRVDVLNSSRRVRVVVGDHTVADSTRPRILFETGLPTRYYLPRADVRMDLLEPTDTSTQCPYKGVASYWRMRGGLDRDVCWTYRFPIPECPKIEDLVCFFNERVDELWVAGELQPKPKTPWS
jgi:uncharacterized protein (DUF427 family)